MYKILLCLRYLRTRYIALASIVSVMLGVATMIVVNSVMAGFSTEMRERIHGILADIIVEANSADGTDDARKRMALAKQAGGDLIEAMTATVEIYGMLHFNYSGQWITRPVTLIGITPEGKAKVGPLVDSLDSYQDIRDDADKVIRPALRSHDEPPGWELTAAASTYRRRWVERQRAFREQWQDQSSHFEMPDEPGSEKTSDPFGSSSRNGTTSNSNSTNENNEPPPFIERSDDSNVDATNNVAANDDPFTKNNTTDGEAEQVDVDPAALLPARLYVGAGLLEFPYEDRETGEIKMMRMVMPGDDVKLSTVSAGRPPEARHFNATVVDVFKSGMSEYDSNLVFCNLEYLQQVRGMIDPQSGARAITSIQIKLKDYSDADEVVKRLRAVFPPDKFTVRTWEQKQGPLLAAVEIETAILNVLLFLIIAVAGFGILAIFFMIVVEKTRDIGILKSLGASSRGVMTIFLSYGLALGIVGSGVGVILGLVFVHYINEIEKRLTWIIGRKVFDEAIYYFPKIPTAVNASMVFWVACGAIAIAVLASILPARRAARFHPVEALRYQ